jgi:hypothetical protein
MSTIVFVEPGAEMPSTDGLRLWLDDQRKAPWGYDLVAKTADECIARLDLHGDAIGHVSLDHDLDPSHYGRGLKGEPIDRAAFGTKTGFAVLEWMAETGRWARDISIHTLNPARRGRHARVP